MHPVMKVATTRIFSITSMVFLPFFLITVYLQGVESFGKLRPERYKLFKKRCNVEKTEIINSSIKDNETNTDGYIDPHYNCDILEKVIVQKISYQSTLPSFSTSCGVVDVSFTSACVKCGMCLAIAQQMNKTLIDVHKTMMPIHWLNDADATLLLRAICKNSFEHYSLRELDGNYFICDRIPGSTLVTSSVDGQWDKHLKKKCNEYLDEMGPIRLYERWQRWCNNGIENGPESPDLTTILCRDDTTFFRDCRSIEYTKQNEIPLENFEPHVKILMELEWR